MTKPLPETLRARLSKVVPMLSSPVPGEVVAATEAITRILKAEGFDWHDFTAWSQAPAPAAPKPIAAELSSAELLSLIQTINDSGCFLSSRSKEFLDSLGEKALKYDTVFFSEKQHSWITSLSAAATAASTQGIHP